MNRIYEGMSIREISEFLFVEDEAEQADLIFVFGSGRPERAEKAVELYRAGLAKQIWVAGGDKTDSGISEAENLKRVMTKSGVPAEDIHTETKSTTTLEHVLYSIPLLDKTYGWNNLKKVALVSSPHHMRRVKRVFANHCPAETKILCLPDDRPEIRANNWWISDKGRRIVLRELEKVRDFALKGEY